VSRIRQRGFTLIELMIALVVSSLLVGMILAIFNRMSLAYRTQQQIAGLQQVLAAARAAIELDAKQAGLQVAQGFRVATRPTVYQSPVQVINNRANKGADQIAFFYADPSAQGVVANGAANWTNDPTITITAASPGGFVVGDLAILVEADPAGAAVNGQNVATFRSCVVQITSVANNGRDLHFSVAAPWGGFNEPQCENLPSPPIWTPDPNHGMHGTMIYRFVAHAYRIDNATSDARTALGPLQQSLTGGLFNDEVLDGWTDIAYGFTDLQAAIQVFHSTWSPVDTLDVDTDPNRDWYSGDLMTTLTATSFNVANGNPATPLDRLTEGLMQMSISLVARNEHDFADEGIVTTATPKLTEDVRPVNNTLGDRDTIPLPSVDPALAGNRLFRFMTFRVDFRNLEIAR
jgi:prepilin-type N-terminal cleavage/methylation domain-containing protein